MKQTLLFVEYSRMVHKVEHRKACAALQQVQILTSCLLRMLLKRHDR
jgi:hypothetical protein